MATIYKRSAITTLNTNTAWDLTGAGGAGPAGPPGATDTAYWQAASLGGTLTGAISPLAVQIDGATADITYTSNTLSVGTGGITFGVGNNKRLNVTTGVISVGANNQTWALCHTTQSSNIGLSGAGALTGSATINVTNNSGFASNGYAYILPAGAQAGFTGTFVMQNYTAIAVSGASNLTAANITIDGTGVTLYNANPSGDTLGGAGKTLTVNNNFGFGTGGRTLSSPMNVAFGAVTRTMTVDASTLTLSGAITGTAGFTKAGAGSLTVTGASPGLSGTVVVSGGTYSGRLQLFGTSTTQLPFPNVTAYDINNSGMLFYDSNIAGGGNYTETASFVGASSGNVPCLIKGTLTFQPAVAGGISGARYTTFLCDADLTHPSTTLVFKELPNLDAPPLPVINSGLNFEIYPSGATSMSPKIIIDSVAGGTTNSVMTVGPYAATGTGTYIATLEVNNTAPVTFANTIRKNSSVSTNSVTLRLSGTNPEVTVSGQITELTTPGLVVNKAGTSKWILSNTTNSFTGGVSISAGTLVASGSGTGTNFGSSTTGAVTQTGGTLDISGGLTLNKGTVAANTVGVSGSTALTSTSGNNEWIIGAVAMNSTTIVDIAAGARLKLNNSGALSGVGFGITKNGTGEFELANTDNTFTGAVTVAAGTLTVTKLANSGAGVTSSIGTGAATPAIALTGTLKYNGTGHSTNRSITFTGAAPALDASGSGAVTYSAATQAPGARTITFTGSSTAANTLSAALSDGTGAVSVAKSGAGKWVLSGAMNHTGTTSCAEGTLNFGSTNQILSGALSVSGGTVENSTNTISANTTMTGGTITAELTGNKTLDVNSGSAATLQPTNNANTFSGATTVAAGGILRLITGANPTTAGAGQVLGTSAVSVSGDIKTGATGAQRGQMRYGGNLTFNTGAKLYVGGA